MRRPLVRWSSASRGGLGGRKAAMTFIYVTIVLDTLAFGILIPVLAPLVVSFTSSKAQGALMFGLLLTVWSLMQFLFSPLLGALSDRFGRRPVLILSAIGLGLDYIVMALAPLRSHRGLLGLASSTFLSFLAFQVLPSVFVIYAGVRYGWHELQVGLTLTIVGVCNIAVQGVLVKRVIKRVGERRTLYAGLL